MPREGADDGPRDRDRLEHMLGAGRAAMVFVDGRVRRDLDTDEMLRRALLNAVQEIGEAAARVTDGGRRRVPALPWGQIVAMRHILVHVYWGVDLNQLWKAATEDIPVLVAEVQAALARWPAVEES